VVTPSQLETSSVRNVNASSEEGTSTDQMEVNGVRESGSSNRAAFSRVKWLKVPRDQSQVSPEHYT